MKKFFYLCAIFACLLFPASVLGMDLTASALEAISQDEAVDARDLDVGEPKVLPGSWLYAFKNFRRGVQSVLTFNPIKKAELRLKFADEKLIEAKRLAEESDNPQIIEKALKSYNQELDRISEQVDKTKEKASVKAEKFLDKFADRQIKHQKLIKALEDKVSAKQQIEISQIEDKIAKKAIEIAEKIDTPAGFAKRLEKALVQQKGSEFKDFKHLEILDQIRDQAGEDVKNSLEQVRERALQRIHNNLANSGNKEQILAKFKAYVKNTSGNKVRQIKNLEKITQMQQGDEQIQQGLLQAQEELMKTIEQKIQQTDQATARQTFLRQLENSNDLENMRVLKKLENNLSPETVTKLIEIKNKALVRLKEKILQAETDKQKQAILKQIEQNHDSKVLQILQDMEEIIPQEKQKFWQKVKAKAYSEVNNDIKKTANQQQRLRIINQLTGNTPEDINAIKSFVSDQAIINQVVDQKAKIFEKKIEQLNDPESLRIFKDKINAQADVFNRIRQANPNIITKIEQKEKAQLKQTTKDRAQDQIKKAKELVNRAVKLGFDIHQEKINTMQNHLDQAEKMMQENNFGEAFGQAVSALHQANSIIDFAQRRQLRENNQRVLNPKSKQTNNNTDTSAPDNGGVIKQEDKNEKNEKNDQNQIEPSQNQNQNNSTNNILPRKENNKVNLPFINDLLKKQQQGVDIDNKINNTGKTNKIDELNKTDEANANINTKINHNIDIQAKP